MNMSILKRKCFLRTDIYTVMAVETVSYIPENLRLGELAFRIGAPSAAKGASLKKNGGSDSWSIIYTEFLNIKNSALFISICFDAADIVYIVAVCLLMVIVGIGCALFTFVGTYEAALDRLLEEGDYTPEEKSRKGIIGTVSLVYWLLVTAIFLCVMYLPSINVTPKDTWIIWAVAGVLYGAVMAVVKLIKKK